MNGSVYRNIFIYSGLFLVMTFPAFAQKFEDSTSSVKPVSSVSQQSNGTSGWSKFYQKSNKTAPESSASQNTSQNKGKTQASKGQNKQDNKKEKQVVENPEDYIYKNVQQIDRPTLDGVKRGRTSVVPLIKDGKTTAEGYIYLFYSDFSLHRMMSGSMMCDVKFQILTTFDRRLNSLAIRLKWPHMETPLNFIDVNPNQKYHMTYSLLGDGCYSMDKIPNIVVNRCRIKGMSQEECAQRVRWIRKK